jgi:hypothetical protein
MGKQKEIEITAASVPQQVNNGNTEEKPIIYVVVREGFRVSDREYFTPDDPDAITEMEFWSRIANNHSYGELVDIVQYESKKHRIW